MSTTNQQIVYDYFKNKGLNDKAIAGVMGNIQQESGFNTTATNSSSGAYGLFQWLGSRKTALHQFAQQNNGSASDIDTQLDFMWYELETSEKKTKNALFSDYASASDYATKFEKLFERSGGSALSNRQNYAENFYLNLDDLGKSNIKEYDVNEHLIQVDGTLSQIPKSNDIGLKWWGDIVKVVLVIIVIIIGVVLSVVSFNSTKND